MQSRSTPWRAAGVRGRIEEIVSEGFAALSDDQLHSAIQAMNLSAEESKTVTIEDRVSVAEDGNEDDDDEWYDWYDWEDEKEEEGADANEDKPPEQSSGGSAADGSGAALKVGPDGMIHLISDRRDEDRKLDLPWFPVITRLREWDSAMQDALIMYVGNDVPEKDVYEWYKAIGTKEFDDLRDTGNRS